MSTSHHSTLNFFLFPILVFCLLIIGCTVQEDTTPEEELPVSEWVKDGNYSIFSCPADSSCSRYLVISFKYRLSSEDFEINHSYIYPEDTSSINLNSLSAITQHYLKVKKDGIYKLKGCWFELKEQLFFPNNARYTSWDWYDCQDEISRTVQGHGTDQINVPAGHFETKIISESYGLKYYYHSEEGIIRFESLRDDGSVKKAYLLISKNF